MAKEDDWGSKALTKMEGILSDLVEIHELLQSAKIKLLIKDAKQVRKAIDRLVDERDALLEELEEDDDLEDDED